MSDISIMKTVREQHWRGPVVILALVALPWSIQVFDARDATFLFAWGLVNTNPPMVTPLLDFLFIYTQGLPEYILAWPLSVLAYIGTLGSAVSGVVFDREDPRVTGGLLIIMAIAQLRLAWGFSFQPYRTAWPIASGLCVLIAWWFYWPRVRTHQDRSLFASDE
jgi:uncharacterized protein (TIGR04206 family)